MKIAFSLCLVCFLLFGVISVGLHLATANSWERRTSQQLLVVTVAGLLSIVFLIGAGYTGIRLAVDSLHRQITKLEHPSPVPSQSPNCFPLATKCTVGG